MILSQRDAEISLREAFLDGSAVPNPLRSTAMARPEHPALIASGLTWTGGDLFRGVIRCAARLRQGGVRAGDLVALAGPPSPEWVITFHALGYLGAAVVPLSYSATRDELQVAFEVAAPQRVVLTHGLTPSERARLLELSPEACFVTQLPLGPDPEERFWPLDEVRVVVLTSGSTGRPQAVALTTSQILFSAFGSAIRLGHQLQDRWLLCLPLHHVGGLSILFRCAFYGTTVVLHERFDVAGVTRELDSGRISLVSLVPQMLNRVLDSRPSEPFPANLRAILLGGDRTPAGLVARCREIQAPLAITWGMTEAASQVTTRLPGDLADDSGCGAPLPFVRVEGDEPFLTLRGPLTVGALSTRDCGAVDDRGRVHVTGRQEEFLVSGGVTIGVTELEAVLAQHPDVSDAGVVGLPDRRWGQRPVAILVPEGADCPTDEELHAYCREHLSAYKTPRQFVWTEELPRSSLGKLSRSRLRELALKRSGEEGSELPQPSRPALSLGGRAEEVLEGLLQASRKGGSDSLGERLEELRACVAGDLLSLDGGICEVAKRLDSEPQKARKAAIHLLGRSGKRLRPLCSLLAARLGGRQLDLEVQRVAISAELVHAATLLHDDVIDEGGERRGAPAARIVYGNSASVLGGDFLFAESLRLVAEVGDPPLLARLLEVITDMVAAEAHQLERRGKLDLDRESYWRVIEGKTAALFRWAFWAGGRLGGLPEATTLALADAGAALGLAFQLVDDVIDLEGDPRETGKDRLGDLQQGKMTWPLLLACERDPQLKPLLEGLLARSEEELEPEVLAEVVERVRQSGALEDTRALAAEHGGRALAELGLLPECWVRNALEAVVETAVTRSR